MNLLIVKSRKYKMNGEYAMSKKQNLYRFFLVFFNIIFSICIGIYAYYYSNQSISMNAGCSMIAWLSIVTLIIQLTQLKLSSVRIISVLGFFVIAMHLFSFGEFYVAAAGKSDFLVYKNWFTSDFYIKIKAALFCIAAIESVFVGIMLHLSFNKSDVNDVNKDISNSRWRFIGVCLLIVGLPCRLIWDYLSIQMASETNTYSGGANVSGLIDDLQFLFIPGLICLLHSFRHKKGLVLFVLLFVTGVSMIIMSLSGIRRLYITGIVGLMFYYFYEYNWKKHSIFKIIISIVCVIVILNFIEMIRKNRFIGLGSDFFNNITIWDFFSIDFIWDSFAEFGLTSHAIYYDFVYFPTEASHYNGLTFLYAIIYIFPVGFIYNVNQQGASIIESLSGVAVGGSILNDLFINFGWSSLFLAPLLGLFLSWLCYKPVKRGYINLDNIRTFFLCSILLNYARGDIMELLRPSVYILIFFYLLLKIRGLNDNNDKYQISFSLEKNT